MIVLAGVVRALGCECHRHGSRDLARAWRGAFRISRERGMAWCRRATWQYCPGSVGSIAGGRAEATGPRSTRAKICAKMRDAAVLRRGHRDRVVIRRLGAEQMVNEIVP